MNLAHASFTNDFLYIPGSDTASRHDDDAAGGLFVKSGDELQSFQA
jgi:hypothetical protein